MSAEREDRPDPGAGLSDRPPDEDERIEAFSEAITDPAEIRRRGRAMSAEDEAAYLAAADEDPDYQVEIQEELRSLQERGVVDDEPSGGVRTGKSVRIRVPAGREPAEPSSGQGRERAAVDEAEPGSPVPGRGRVAPPPGDRDPGVDPAVEVDGEGAMRSASEVPGRGRRGSWTGLDEDAGGVEPRAGVADVGRRPMPSPSGSPGVGVSAGPAGKVVRLDEAQLSEITDAVGEGIKVLGSAVDDGIRDIKAEMPQVREGEVGELVAGVGRLGELLRVQQSDRARRHEVGRRWWLWPLRGLMVAAVVVALGGGVFIQARLGVLDDGTNGWKDIVWQHHGIKIADCMDRADKRGGGARCGVRAEVR